MAKRRSEKLGRTKQDRVRWLLRNIWQNSQTKMAKDTGLSQSTISNVVTGRYEPGGKVFAAIAAHPLVNARWLMTGEEEPLEIEQAWALPVTASPLPGPPAKYTHLLTGESMAVARESYCDSRYFFRAPDLLSEGIFSGDLILMESDIAGWAQHPESLVGELCVVRTGEKGGQKGAIGRVRTWLPRDPMLHVQILWPSTDMEPEWTQEEKAIRKRSRSISLDPGPLKSAAGLRALDISVKDVVSVAIRLERLSLKTKPR